MRSKCLAIMLGAGVLAAGCGADEARDPAARPDKPVEVVDVNKDPRAITCGELADKVASARLSRTASFTLADEALERRPKLSRKTNRNLLAQQIFAGMVEVCGEQQASYRPADDAVERAVSRL